MRFICFFTREIPLYMVYVKSTIVHGVKVFSTYEDADSYADNISETVNDFMSVSDDDVNKWISYYTNGNLITMPDTHEVFVLA